MSQPQTAVVIGAGIGGIAIATYLVKAGYNVHVYEQHDKPGGRANVRTENGFTFDTGPSWYLMPEVFEHFFQLCDTSTAEQLDLVRLDPAYRVFFEQDPPITIGADQRANQAAFEAIEPGAGAKLQHYAKRSSLLYKLSLDHFLYINFQSLRDVLHLDIVRNGPRFLGLLGRSFDQEVSRYFKHPHLKMILEYSAVFLGASPYRTPALYTLMGALDFDSGVYYPRGGIYRLIEQMYKLSMQAGATYHFNQPVRRITGAGGKVAGIALSSGQSAAADIVIANGDLHHTETQLLRPAHQTYPESYWRKQVSGPSALLLYLGVKGKLPELLHHDLLFVDAWRENFQAIYETHTIPDPASIYISKATATDPAFAPAGHEALVVLIPLPADVALTDDEQKNLAQRSIAQIERMTGIYNLTKRIVSQSMMGPVDFQKQFNAWQYSMLGPGHTLCQTAIFRTGNYSKKLRGLYYVGGSTIPGVGMPMCVISAELVYKRIVGDKRGGQITHIPRRRWEQGA